MKKNLTVLTLVGALAAGMTITAPTFAADSKKPKPYPLKTCVVTDEEINEKGDMKPYAFVHEGREVRLCCKSCLKDFKKEPAKYMAKIDAAEKKEKEKEKK
jgi:hypothetical protein